MNTPADGDEGLAAHPSTGLRRYAVATGVVALWMSIGWASGLSGDAYLLLGIPLLVLFQALVARRPLLKVWFASPGRFALPWWGWLVAAAFMIEPIRDLATWRNPGLAAQLWLVCAALGAVPLAWSLVRCTPAQWRLLGMCVLTVGAVGILTLSIAHLSGPHSTRAAAVRIADGLRSFARYLPVIFMIEEVFFRGGLDSYLARGVTGSPWPSAFYVSALWGLWHLAALPQQPGRPLAQWVAIAVVLTLVHCGVGPLLSIFWRRSGLLLVPACAHAFIDAVRNALQ